MAAVPSVSLTLRKLEKAYGKKDDEILQLEYALLDAYNQILHLQETLRSNKCKSNSQ
jgi:hypothetical protein